MTTTDTIHPQGLFAGRLGRLNYFIGNLILVPFTTLSAFILTIVGIIFAIANSPWFALLILLAFALAILGLIIGTSMLVRRLHDFGQSGFWVFVYVLLGISIFLIPLQWLFALIVLFSPGDEQANQYGSPPEGGISLGKAWFNK